MPTAITICVNSSSDFLFWLFHKFFEKLHHGDFILVLTSAHVLCFFVQQSNPQIMESVALKFFDYHIDLSSILYYMIQACGTITSRIIHFFIIDSQCRSYDWMCEHYW